MKASSMNAVCIKCGAFKNAPWKTCSRCHLDPTQREGDLLRSVYLSVGRFADPEEQKRYRETLVEIARGIEGGQLPEFDAAELERLRKEKVLVDSVPARAVWGAVIRMFVPAILFLLLLFLVLLLLRMFA